MLNRIKSSLPIQRISSSIGLFLLLFSFTCFSPNKLQAQSSEGDIMFVAYNGDGDDGFAIVALVDLPANSTIYFNDNEWNGMAIGSGGAFDGTGEGEMTWDTGGAIITAGTVVTFDDIDNSSNPGFGVSVGTLTGSTALTAGDEVIYAFIGTDNVTPTKFLSAIANDEFNVTNGQLTNTGLTAGVDAVNIDGDEDVMAYTGSTVCDGTQAECAAQVANTANWTTQDGSGDQSIDTTTPDFPDDVPGNFTGSLFGSSDVTAPMLTSSNPTDDAVNFTGTDITLTFDEDVVRGSGGIGLFNTSDNSSFLVMGAGSNRISITDNVVTISLGRALPVDQQVYLRVQTGAFEDAAGNDFAGIFSSTALNFSAPSKPNLTSTTPVDDSNDFNGTSLTFTFDEDMKIGQGRISILDASDDSEIFGAGVASARVSISGAVVILNMGRELPLSKDVYVRIPASALSSTNDIPFAGILDETTLNFSTATIPVLFMTDPIDDGVDFSGTSMTFTFDRTLLKGTGRISIRDAADDSEIRGAGVNSTRVSISGNQVTLNLITALPLGRQVYVNVPASAFKDANDIFYPGIQDKTTLNFSTPTTPMLSSSIPEDDISGVLESTITLTFDRNVIKGSGRISLLNAVGDTEVSGTGVGSSRVTIADNIVTIDLPGTLPIDAALYLRVPATAFKDANDRFFAGILDKTTLNFDTNILVLEEVANFSEGLEATGNNVSILNLYPNPATDEIIIDLSQIGEELDVKILGLDGTVKFNKDRVKIPQLTVNVSGYAQGIYIVAAQSESGQRVYKKFVIGK